MSSTNKASIKLASAQALTSTFTVTSLVGSYSIRDESLVTLDLQYTTGAAETGTACQYQIELSYDGSFWVSETASTISGTTDTQTSLVHAFGGGAGATSYTAQYVLPTCSQFIRVKVKETGSPSNPGSVSVVLTTASASGQSRNAMTGAITGAVTISGSLPAGTNLLGRISASQETSTIYNGTTALTPKFAKANVAASQTDANIVSAVTSKKIRVLQMFALAGGTATDLTFNTKPAGAGTAISPLMANTSNGGEVLPFSPIGWMETASGEGLTVTTGTGSTTGILVVYVEL